VWLWEATQIEARQGRAGGPERGERCAGGCPLSLAGPAGLRLLDAPPGPGRPGTEGPWAFQRGARAVAGRGAGRPRRPA
jgi:hypothetical protein